MEVSGQLHVSASLALWIEAPLYPLERRLGGPQSRLEWCGRQKESAVGTLPLVVRLVSIIAVLGCTRIILEWVDGNRPLIRTLD